MSQCPAGSVAPEGASIGPVHQASSRDCGSARATPQARSTKATR